MLPACRQQAARGTGHGRALRLHPRDPAPGPAVAGNRRRHLPPGPPRLVRQPATHPLRPDRHHRLHGIRRHPGPHATHRVPARRTPPGRGLAGQTHGPGTPGGTGVLPAAPPLGRPASGPAGVQCAGGRLVPQVARRRPQHLADCPAARAFRPRAVAQRTVHAPRDDERLPGRPAAGFPGSSSFTWNA